MRAIRRRSRPEETQAKLGGGPGMFLYDSSALPNRKMVALVKKTAAANGHAAAARSGAGLWGRLGGDAEEQRRRPDGQLVVPVRYTHAHNGIVNRKDFDQTVDLVVALLVGA